jgi:hypothetical protein
MKQAKGDAQSHPLCCCFLKALPWVQVDIVAGFSCHHSRIQRRNCVKAMLKYKAGYKSLSGFTGKCYDHRSVFFYLELVARPVVKQSDE